MVDECLSRVRNLKAYDPDVTIEVEGGLNRPPYEIDDGIKALYEHARGLAGELGFDLVGVKTGGGSDGNFTAALGVPTLDGLGADGKGAHAIDEQIYVSSLEPRTKLLLRLFETLS
jgi:glutamate carboxypeptidase